MQPGSSPCLTLLLDRQVAAVARSAFHSGWPLQADADLKLGRICRWSSHLTQQDPSQKHYGLKVPVGAWGWKWGRWAFHPSFPTPRAQGLWHPIRKGHKALEALWVGGVRFFTPPSTREASKASSPFVMGCVSKSAPLEKDIGLQKPCKYGKRGFLPLLPTMRGQSGLCLKRLDPSAPPHPDPNSGSGVSGPTSTPTSQQLQLVHCLHPFVDKNHLIMVSHPLVTSRLNYSNEL